MIGECWLKRRHDEFLKFLKTLDKRTDKTLDVHLIVDNYATHKHPNVKDWLVKHLRFHMHFTPTSASWINLVERFFRDMTEEPIRRGVFRTVEELKAAIMQYLKHRNINPNLTSGQQSPTLFWQQSPKLKKRWGRYTRAAS